MTSLATAFEKAGLHPRDAEFDIAIAKYLNSGGTIEGAQLRLRAASEKVSGDRHGLRAAECGQFNPATSPEIHRDRGGHFGNASTSGPFAVAASAREPSITQRRAAANVRKVVAITVLDTFKIRDGRAIGDVRMGEVERLRAANAMEAAIFRQIQKHAVTGSDARIRDVISPSDFQRMQQVAAEVADAQ